MFKLEKYIYTRVLSLTLHYWEINLKPTQCVLINMNTSNNMPKSIKMQQSSRRKSCLLN